MKRSRLPLLALGISLALVACDKKGGKNQLFPQEDKPDNLGALLDTIVKTSEAGDVAKAGALTRGLIPDAAAFKKALKDDAPAELHATLAEALKGLPADDKELGGLVKRGEPDRTQVNVHGATTEEIRDQSTPAAGEFPGGAKKAAATVLRPGMKFYEVEFVKPGEDLGMKFPLFFWDGGQWRMLGPVWRSLPQGE